MAGPWENDPIVQPSTAGGQQPWMSDPIVQPSQQGGGAQEDPGRRSAPTTQAGRRTNANIARGASPRVDPATMPAIPTARQLPAGAEAIHRTETGGEVYRRQDGSLGFVSDGLSSSDPETIMNILEGRDPGTPERAVNRAYVEENLGPARLATGLQGVIGGGSYVDEVVSAVNGPEAGASVNRLQSAMDDARPGEATALRLAGTAASAIPAALAVAPSATAATTTRGAALLRNGILGGVAGGAEGAIYGAGEQEGGRMSNALLQGTLGAGLGVASGLAVTAIDRALLSRASALRNQSVDAIQNELGVSPQAAQLIREALDGGELEAAARTLERRGPNALLAEASPALRQLLNTMTKTNVAAGSIAGREIGRESARRYGVLTEVMDDVMGAPQGREVVQEGVMTGSRPARSQAYDAAYSSPIDYSTPAGIRLENTLQNRLPRGMIERANNAMREAGEQSPQIMAQIADDGTVTFSRPLSVQQIDYITRELQTMEGAARRADGRAADAVRWGALRRDIRDTLRDLVPAYGDALDAGADAIAQREALDLGTRALNMRRGELLFELRGASDAERRMVAQGLREQIDDTMARAGEVASDRDIPSREVRRVFQPLTSRQGRENLIAILGPEDGRRVHQAIEQAGDGLELRAAIARNSDTAITQATQGRARELTSGDLFEAVGDLSVGEARRNLVHALAGSSSEAQELRLGNLAREIATVLTGQTGEGAQRALRIIGEYVDNPQAMPDAEAQFVARILTRAGVLSAYQQSRLALTPQ